MGFELFDKTLHLIRLVVPKNLHMTETSHRVSVKRFEGSARGSVLDMKHFGVLLMDCETSMKSFFQQAVERELIERGYAKDVMTVGLTTQAHARPSRVQLVSAVFELVKCHLFFSLKLSSRQYVLLLQHWHGPSTCVRWR